MGASKGKCKISSTLGLVFLIVQRPVKSGMCAYLEGKDLRDRRIADTPHHTQRPALETVPYFERKVIGKYG